MKFCPLCKKDYNDEENHCPECGKELLAGIFGENSVIFDDSKEDLVLKIYNHLCECGLNTIQYYYDDHNDLYCITADSKEYRAAKEAILFYIDSDTTSSELSEYERSIILDRTSSIIDELVPDEGAKTYINAKEKYDDVMSSATSLIFVSILGFIFVGLVFFKIINLNMNILFYVLSLAMFFLFLIMGITSLMKAFKLKANIPVEESLSEEIKDFFLNEINTSSLEEELAASSQTNEEKYFSRTAYLKECASNKFKNSDELLIDGMIEEVYNDVFPEN